MKSIKQLGIENIHFDKIKIDVYLADVMTDNQQEVFVRKFFAV